MALLCGSDLVVRTAANETLLFKKLQADRQSDISTYKDRPISLWFMRSSKLEPQ